MFYVTSWRELLALYKRRFTKAISFFSDGCLLTRRCAYLLVLILNFHVKSFTDSRYVDISIFDFIPENFKGDQTFSSHRDLFLFF